jgi:hypothetical protein
MLMKNTKKKRKSLKRIIQTYKRNSL